MTKLDIWNQALALLPHDRRVEAEDEDTTEALRCRTHYDAARRHVLVSHEWGFLTMAGPTDTCPPERSCGAAFAYSRPGFALRVLGLYTQDGRRLDATAVDGILVTHLPAASIRWLRDSEDPDEWPCQVQDAVAYELAARICPVVTGNPVRETALKASAAQTLREAWLSDSMETAYMGTDGRTYINARR